MHISEGILPAWSLGAGALLSMPGLYIGFKCLTPKKMPETALLTSGFFVASLIHIPIGPTSAHLLLNGLLGIILGPRAMPAIMIALTLQAILFQFGGITTLGVNTFTMGYPALLCYICCHGIIKRRHPLAAPIVGGLCAGLTVLLSGVLTALFLATAGEGFYLAAKLLISAHMPISVVEALITGVVISGLLKIRPEVFEA